MMAICSISTRFQTDCILLAPVRDIDHQGQERRRVDLYQPDFFSFLQKTLDKDCFSQNRA